MRKINSLTFGLILLSLALTHCQHLSLSKPEGREAQTPLPGGSRSQDLLNPVTPPESSVSGEYLRSFLVAYDAFERDSDIPEQKRKLENYDVQFRQNGEAYYICFVAKRTPPGVAVPGGGTEHGRDVTYEISKKDHQVVARRFYK